jgi:hypothetical protein
VKGHEPVEIPVGEIFQIEVVGSQELRRARMEMRPSGECYTVQGYSLRDGLRARFYDQREWYAKIVDG